ncbi:hypothetical protein [Desulfoferula mesophila]|uniref:DUF3298 domain-containing protein n=1 Tax=Desulfoferula mesophila TaxID=3058419 RepID=A0AAU9F4V1_9BACT|nr:hypothetical protein FAK_34430 [Desulfoferula mesophilus]
MRRALAAAAWALILGLAAAAVAGGQTPPVRAVVLLAPAQLRNVQGGAPLVAPALEAWTCVRPEPGGFVAASLGPGGRAVTGRWLARLARPGWPELWLFEPEALPGPWWVPLAAVLGPEPPQVGAQGRVGLKALAWIPSEDAALVPGPAALHASRLARLQTANLPTGLKRRLASGRLEKGDNLWWAELAWGKPQRSFMVNYINDEQHYVYLTPAGPVLLRFVGGRLQEVPGSAARQGAKVANPSTHR